MTLLVGHIIRYIAHLGNSIVHCVIVEQVVTVIDVIGGMERRGAAAGRQRSAGAVVAAATWALCVSVWCGVFAFAAKVREI